MRVEIVKTAIAADAIVAEMKAGADGAVCVFDGIVRDNTRGRRTLHLDYEAYEEMALEQRGQSTGTVALHRAAFQQLAAHRKTVLSEMVGSGLLALAGVLLLVA